MNDILHVASMIQLDEISERVTAMLQEFLKPVVLF